MSTGNRQVLQDFYVQATRTSRADAITHDQAVGLIESWGRCPLQVTTVDVMRVALATRHRFGNSCWDAAILEAGRALGCAVVLSEDLDTTIDYDGIRVANPLTRSGLTDHLVGRSRQREAKG